jgi:hypothetical protein
MDKEIFKPTVLPNHESAVRRMVADAKGAPYYARSDLLLKRKPLPMAWLFLKVTTGDRFILWLGPHLLNALKMSCKNSSPKSIPGNGVIPMVRGFTLKFIRLVAV